VVALSLQQQLEQIAAGLPAGKMGIYVKALKNGQEWAVGADERYPLASVLKVPVLVEYCRQVRQGQLKPGDRIAVTHPSPGSGILKELDPGLQPTLQDLVTLMIIRSDNTATDMVISRVGLENVNRAMDRLGLTNVRVTMDCRTLLYNCFGLAAPGSPPGPELVAEYERRANAGERDDNAIAYSDSLENDIGTPREMGILLELLYKGEAFDSVSSEAALGVLKRQQIRDRLPRLLPEDAKLAHKTGSIWGVRNDVGIIDTPAGPIIAACLSNGCGDETAAAADAIARVGKAVWDQFSA
jgi:beta-lactamase class A